MSAQDANGIYQGEDGLFNNLLSIATEWTCGKENVL